MACLAQRDPLAALARGHHAYIYEQRYTPRPDAREVTRVLSRCLDLLLGEHGVDEILAHPWARLHIITARGRGMAASARRPVLMAALALAAAGNLVSRRTLALQMQRCIFHSTGDAGSPFAQLADLPTTHIELTRENVRAVLLASGSIPLLLEGVRIPAGDAGEAGGTGDASPGGVHWDGGVLDYHLDLDFGPGDGIVLYPHFHGHVVPGWFDKALKWRRARGHNFARALLVAPSESFVARLHGGKIPDRRDFYAMPEAERIRRWQHALDVSAELGDELRELVTTGRIAEAVEPW
jgi:hypothetical protein